MISGMNRRCSPLVAVGHVNVQIDDPFWSPRLETNRARTIPFAIRQCEETGRFDNFAKAGRLMPGEFRGLYYDDSDVFKVIEGIAYSLAQHSNTGLDAYLDALITKIAAAQEVDGYLYTNRTINPAAVQPAAGPERWSRLKHSHELYNVGHLYEAAVAHFESTGKRTLLDVALKNAELIVNTFGPGKRQDVPGHQEIEIGLMKLYRVTGDRRFIELAKFFLDQRGNAAGHPLYGEYAQDHLPIVKQNEAVGHAVRAFYMYCGLADVAAETGDATYFDALETVWTDIVARKMAVTGGVGARKEGEAFGAPYELPNATSYNETCAAIAHVFFNHRLFLATGEAKYLDVLERTLYNGLLAGVSRSGDRFFYVNPLASDGVTPFNYGNHVVRATWFKCSCCPVNLIRFLASLGRYAYATDRKSELYINLFIAGSASIELAIGRVAITQSGDYPTGGAVRIAIDPVKPAELTVRVRIPGWARGKPVPSDLYRYDHDVPNGEVEVRVNGEAVAGVIAAGFATIKRTWSRGDTVELTLPMPIRRVKAHPLLADDVARVALERGPIVYCVEQADVNGVDAIELSDVAGMTAEPVNDPALGSYVRIENDAGKFVAVPYHLWAHRGAGAMAVWVRDGRVTLAANA